MLSSGGSDKRFSKPHYDFIQTISKDEKILLEIKSKPDQRQSEIFGQLVQFIVGKVHRMNQWMVLSKFQR